MPIAIYALFAAAFAIGTSEFVIAGILPEVSGDLGVSIPTAGLLVSFYAFGVAVGGPVLALFTGSAPRRLLLLIYVGIFTVGHVLCALAPNYDLLMAARIGIALIHGAYFGTAMVVATALAPVERRGSAVALLLAGLTVANIIGVPLGTAIGQNFGWRATFWCVGLLGALAFVAIVLLIPKLPGVPASQGSVMREIKALGRAPVYMSLLVIIFATIGQFAVFTYISPLLTEISGIPASMVPWLLLLFGVGSTIGVLVGGRLADWKLMPSLIGILIIETIVLALMGLLAWQPYVMALLVLVWGSLAFAFGSPVQSRILGNTTDAPMLASTLIPSAFNVAIALGALLGGALIEAGSSYAILPWIGALGALISVLIAIVSWRMDARR
jgi:DHA1 family inner membrane transport protein